MLIIDLVKSDGTRERRCCPEPENHFRLAKEEIPAGVRYVEIRHDAFCARAGEDGYMVVPNTFMGEEGNPCHSALIRFRARPDTEACFPRHPMPLYGIVRNGRGLLAVVTGMALDYDLIAACWNGEYSLYPRFRLYEDGAPEDLELRFFALEGSEADYSGMARRYRRYRLEKDCVPLRERSRRYPVLAEMAEGPLVRLRLAWKPVPPPVLEQTPENEPPIHVAMTFDRVCELMDEFHRQGIEHAEFQLVGWNKSGHDGRFPDLYPVEPLLGGEEGMRKVIARAHAYGYLISCHTNVYDSYTIASRWRREDMIKDRNGEIVPGGRWGGGQSYFPCPKAAYEHYAVQDLRELKAFGFRGMHYFDVMSIVPTRRCYDPAHPLTRTEAARWRAKTMALAREEIGASGSEGPFDFCAAEMDYVLYAIFTPDAPLPPICDEKIPLWFLVYHGILSYNPTCETVNSAIRTDDPDPELRMVEYGGRPFAYFYSKFLSSGVNWMGEQDCTAATDEEMRWCVSRIREQYDRYRELRDLQFEFMERYETLAENVALITYSGGSVLLVNRSDQTYDGVPPHSYRRRNSR